MTTTANTLVKNFTYTDSTQYTFDPTKVEFLGQGTTLRAQSSGDFTYDVLNPSVTSEALYCDGIVGFSAATTLTETGDEVRFSILVEDVEYYWNATTYRWAVNTSGYVNANTAADINANASSLLGSAKNVKIRAYLHSNTGEGVAPVLNLVSVIYDFAVEQPTMDKVIVYDWMKLADGTPSGVSLAFSPDIENLGSATSGVILPQIMAVSPRKEDGYFEIALARYINNEPAKYIVTINSKPHPFTITSTAETQKLSDLLLEASNTSS